jgi:Cof subfamily protein (haloacid dehalogenase superfamily)
MTKQGVAGHARNASRPSAPIRLLALDVDGTILDTKGQLDDQVRKAIHDALDAGVRVVLCTGRRFRRASAVASRIGLAEPMVCNSGALVKCPVSAETLWRADHPVEHVRAMLRLFRSKHLPTLSFRDAGPEGPDFVTGEFPSGCDLFDQYLTANDGLGTIDPDWHDRIAEDAPHFHVCAAGTREAMARIDAELHADMPDARFRTFVQKSPNYVAWMCEVLRSDASKWTALRTLTDLWGISPESVCAVGDDANDVPMIAAAGWGVVMGHAERFVKDAADWIAPSNAEHGVAEVVRIVLESRR